MSERRTFAEAAGRKALDDPDEKQAFAQLLWAGAEAADNHALTPLWQARLEAILDAVVRNEHRTTTQREIRRLLGEIRGEFQDEGMVPKETSE